MKYSYKILVDSREKNPWKFEFGVQGNYECLGIEKKKLNEGDYSIDGYSDKFVIEKKSGSAEIYQNCMEKRFEEELKRLEVYEHPFLIVECDYKDVVCFPIGSSVPKNLWYKVEKNAVFFEQKILYYQLKYRTKWIFAGPFGQHCAQQLIHRFLKHG